MKNCHFVKVDETKLWVVNDDTGDVHLTLRLTIDGLNISGDENLMIFPRATNVVIVSEINDDEETPEIS